LPNENAKPPIKDKKLFDKLKNETKPNGIGRLEFLRQIAL
jgi:hypothetical protein